MQLIVPYPSEISKITNIYSDSSVIVSIKTVNSSWMTFAALPGMIIQDLV